MSVRLMPQWHGAIQREAAEQIVTRHASAVRKGAYLFRESTSSTAANTFSLTLFAPHALAVLHYKVLVNPTSGQWVIENFYGEQNGDAVCASLDMLVHQLNKNFEPVFVAVASAVRGMSGTDDPDGEAKRLRDALAASQGGYAAVPTFVAASGVAQPQVPVVKGIPASQDVVDGDVRPAAENHYVQLRGRQSAEIEIYTPLRPEAQLQVLANRPDILYAPIAGKHPGEGNALGARREKSPSPSSASATGREESEYGIALSAQQPSQHATQPGLSPLDLSGSVGTPLLSSASFGLPNSSSLPSMGLPRLAHPAVENDSRPSPHASLTGSRASLSLTRSGSYQDARGLFEVRVGDYVEILNKQRLGTGVVKFIGMVRKKKSKYAADTIFAGLQFDSAVGANDGSLEGTQYFTCRKKHGLFAPVNEIGAKVLQSGWVSKKASKDVQVNKFQRRWLELKVYLVSRSAFLYYFKTEREDKARGIIPITYLTRVSDNPVELLQKHSNPDLSFTVVTPERQYWFDAIDNSKKHAWINAISTAISSVQEPCSGTIA